MLKKYIFKIKIIIIYLNLFLKIRQNPPSPHIHTHSLLHSYLLPDNTVDCVGYHYDIITLSLFITPFHLQMTQSMAWAATAAMSLQRQCLFIISRNMSLWHMYNNTLLPPIDIEGALCPNSCHDNGHCNMGNCFPLILVLNCLLS